VTIPADNICLGIDAIASEEVTIKLEPMKAKHFQLKHESKVYKMFASGVRVLLLLILAVEVFGIWFFSCHC
jgi:citrate lyase gamma subunit